MDILQNVFDSAAWKKDSTYCANRLGITVDYFNDLKKIIKVQGIDRAKLILQPDLESNQSHSQVTTEPVIEQKVNIEAGTAELKAIVDFEPLTPEEIIRILKIDTTKWKLTMYWNKQQPNGKTWVISAQVTLIKVDKVVDLKNVIADLDLKYIPHNHLAVNEAFSDKTCAVISLQDIHVAKKNMVDTGASIEDDVKSCIKNLVLRSYHSNYLDKIVFVLGGDLVNMDTYLGTTTQLTPVENGMPATEAYKLAFELMFWSVNFLKQYCNELEILYIPGNHSRLTEAHIAYSLSRCITDPHIIWNIEYAERKVVVYGNSMLCFEHGDFDTKRSFFVFATEFSEQWGKAKFRVCYTGHYHKEKKIEYITADEINGFTLRVLPSLTGTDKWHHSNKWTMNKRGGIIELHSISEGPTGQFSNYK